MQLWDAVVSKDTSPRSQPELFIMNQLQSPYLQPQVLISKPSGTLVLWGVSLLNTECLSAQWLGLPPLPPPYASGSVVRWSGVPALGPTAWVQVQTLLLTSCDIWCQLVNLCLPPMVLLPRSLPYLQRISKIASILK